MIRRCQAEVEGRAKRLVRAALLPLIKRRHGIAELGEGFQWGKKMLIGRGSRIGRYAYLGPGFESHGPIVVGDLCMVAADCRVIGADHLFDIVGTPTRLGWPTEARKVTVLGMDAWIGARVTIMEGVTIGAGAIVGSGATVVRDVAPYTIVGGTPAKLIRERFTAEQRAAHLAGLETGVDDAHGGTIDA